MKTERKKESRDGLPSWLLSEDELQKREEENRVARNTRRALRREMAKQYAAMVKTLGHKKTQKQIREQKKSLKNAKLRSQRRAVRDIATYKGR